MYLVLYDGGSTQMWNAEGHLGPGPLEQDGNGEDGGGEDLNTDEENNDANAHADEEDTDEEDLEQLAGEGGCSQNAIPEGGGVCVKGVWWNRADDMRGGRSS